MTDYCWQQNQDASNKTFYNITIPLQWALVNNYKWPGNENL